MSEAYICDRCHDISRRHEWRVGGGSTVENMQSGAVYHLCSDCTETIENDIRNHAD